MSTNWKKPANGPSELRLDQSKRTKSTVQWLQDGKHLLVAAAGDLFIVDASKGSFENVTQTPETEADPKLSPDNRFVSFRRGSDLYAMEVGTRHVTRLTGDGTETLLNGRMDWVYPEELELSTAHWWSPDSRSIAYLQFDVSREPFYPQVSLLGTRALAEPERYPKAGDPNAEVRLGIVAVGGGSTKWMELGDPRDSLLARVAWSPTSRQIMAERLNRVQNRLDLLLADVDTGAAHAVLHEEDKYWINVNLTEGPRFLGKGDRFLWTSERSGFRHLYVYGSDGTLLKQLTSGDWEVHEVAGVDEKRGQIYFTSSEGDPLGLQLFSVGVDGVKGSGFPVVRGGHWISLGPLQSTVGPAHFMDDFSSLSTAPRSTICNLDGSTLRVFRQPETALYERECFVPREELFEAFVDGHGFAARFPARSRTFEARLRSFRQRADSRNPRKISSSFPSSDLPLRRYHRKRILTREQVPA
jgi:dipeptidyl-peptidase 4